MEFLRNKTRILAESIIFFVFGKYVFCLFRYEIPMLKCENIAKIKKTVNVDTVWLNLVLTVYCVVCTK